MRRKLGAIFSALNVEIYQHQKGGEPDAKEQKIPAIPVPVLYGERQLGTQGSFEQGMGPPVSRLQKVLFLGAAALSGHDDWLGQSLKDA